MLRHFRNVGLLLVGSSFGCSNDHDDLFGSGGFGGESATSDTTSAATSQASTSSTQASASGTPVGSSVASGETVGTSASTGVLPCDGDACIDFQTQGGCDQALAIDDSDPISGAKALGLCKMSVGGWGIVEAAYTTTDGAPLDGELALGHGLLASLGPELPHEGARMLALSSGAARGPQDPGFEPTSGFQKSMMEQGPPNGFNPMPATGCTTAPGAPWDSAVLQIKIRTPANAASFSYDSNFYTSEFASYLCTQFNDYFVALMSPPPLGASQLNTCADLDGDPLSANTSFIRACEAQTAPNGEPLTCPLGYGPLLGTGFETAMNPRQGGSTGWLHTEVPIAAPGGEITLRFAIWDSEDHLLDSTVLLDNFRFSPDPKALSTTPQ